MRASIEGGPLKPNNDPDEYKVLPSDAASSNLDAEELERRLQKVATGSKSLTRHEAEDGQHNLGSSAVESAAPPADHTAAATSDSTHAVSDAGAGPAPQSAELPPMPAGGWPQHTFYGGIAVTPQSSVIAGEAINKALARYYPHNMRTADPRYTASKYDDPPALANLIKAAQKRQPAARADDAAANAQQRAQAAPLPGADSNIDVALAQERQPAANAQQHSAPLRSDNSHIDSEAVGNDKTEARGLLKRAWDAFIAAIGSLFSACLPFLAKNKNMEQHDNEHSRDGYEVQHQAQHQNEIGGDRPHNTVQDTSAHRSNQAGQERQGGSESLGP